MHMLHKYLRVEVSKLVLEEQFPEVYTKYNKNLSLGATPKYTKQRS